MRGRGRARAQGCPLRLLPLLPENFHRQPRQAPNHRAEGRPRLGDAQHPRLHVQGRDQRPRAQPHQPHQGGRVPQGPRPNLQRPAAPRGQPQLHPHQPVQRLQGLLPLPFPPQPLPRVVPREGPAHVRRPPQQRVQPDVVDPRRPDV